MEIVDSIWIVLAIIGGGSWLACRLLRHRCVFCTHWIGSLWMLIIHQEGICTVKKVGICGHCRCDDFKKYKGWSPY